MEALFFNRQRENGMRLREEEEGKQDSNGFMTDKSRSQSRILANNRWSVSAAVSLSCGLLHLPWNIMNISGRGKEQQDAAASGQSGDGGKNVRKLGREVNRRGQK